MKKLPLILLGFLLYAFPGFSQVVTQVPVEEIDVEYIEIIGVSRPLSTKMNVVVDFGQEREYLGNKQRVILDENERKMKFNSMMDALNYMSRNGYEFVQAYVIRYEEKNERHFLMRKRISENKNKANTDQAYDPA